MGSRSAVAAVIALALGATAIDFAGRLLSVLADGLFMAGVVAVVWTMHRHHRREVRALREEVRQARAGEIAAARSPDATAGMQTRTSSDSFRSG